jgi:hypothetical protein
MIYRDYQFESTFSLVVWAVFYSAFSLGVFLWGFLSADYEPMPTRIFLSLGLWIFIGGIPGAIACECIAELVERRRKL